ncbi:hypothetical protein [Streptomyces sp. LN590]|uniref:hypothetical protein n=1 Tax=Streptomyces sp. LN590 TaxID=3112980 RepID=UPI003720B59F
MKPIRIGRWQIELYQRAIYIQRQPDLKCLKCKGEGAIETGGGYVLDHTWEADVEPCTCWDPFRSLRIPVSLRSHRQYVGEPF